MARSDTMSAAALLTAIGSLVISAGSLVVSFKGQEVAENANRPMLKAWHARAATSLSVEPFCNGRSVYLSWAADPVEVGLQNAGGREATISAIVVTGWDGGEGWSAYDSTAENVSPAPDVVASLADLRAFYKVAGNQTVPDAEAARAAVRLPLETKGYPLLHWSFYVVSGSTASMESRMEIEFDQGDFDAALEEAVAECETSG